MVNTALDAAALLEQQGISVQIVKLGQVHPLACSAALESAAETGHLFVLEDVVAAGGVGMALAAQVQQSGMYAVRTTLLNLGDRFIQHGCNEQLYQACGLDAHSVASAIVEGTGLGKKET